MARVAPFHSSKDPGVYHVCSNCPEGNNIEPRYKKSGRAGGRLCDTCMRLTTRGKC